LIGKIEVIFYAWFKMSFLEHTSKHCVFGDQTFSHGFPDVHVTDGVEFDTHLSSRHIYIHSYISRISK
jgi:hypothetical protein